MRVVTRRPGESMKQHLLTAAFLLLAGCSSLQEAGGLSAQETYLPSGEKGYSLECSNTNNWGDCHEQAGDICGSAGYDVVERIDEPKTRQRVMLIKCK
jgi:hypothetical protein